MMMDRRRIGLAALICLMGCLGIAGCKGSTDAKNTDQVGGTPTSVEALKSLADLLKHFDQERRKAPSKLAEVEVVEPLFPGAFVGLTTGAIVYSWGIPFETGGTLVIAYEKKTPTEGGAVLLQDGTVKTMTAEEFKAAPKPPLKK